MNKFFGANGLGKLVMNVKILMLIIGHMLMIIFNSQVKFKISKAKEN